MDGKYAICIVEMILLKHPRNLKEKASHHQLKTLLYDGYRFALSHQATIEAGALQVYHSALPFTPHNTLLYNTYALEEAKSMHVLRGVPAEWSPCLASLEGGHGGISSVAYSHDGTLFALGYSSEFITVRAASSGELLSSLEYPAPQEILSLAFLPGDKYLVAGTTAGTVAQWSVLTASIVRSYKGHTSTTCVAVCVKTPNVMASASKDATIRLWDVLTGEPAGVLSATVVLFMPWHSHPAVLVYSRAPKTGSFAYGTYLHPQRAAKYEPCPPTSQALVLSQFPQTVARTALAPLTTRSKYSQ